MREFALAQDQWYPTWPANLEERALAVYVEKSRDGVFTF